MPLQIIFLVFALRDSWLLALRPTSLSEERKHRTNKMRNGSEKPHSTQTELETSMDFLMEKRRGGGVFYYTLDLGEHFPATLKTITDRGSELNFFLLFVLLLLAITIHSIFDRKTLPFPLSPGKDAQSTGGEKTTVFYSS